MSLKRYAILAAVSYHNSQQNEQATTTTTTTKKPTGLLKKQSQHSILNATQTQTQLPTAPAPAPSLAAWTPLKIATKSMITTTKSNTNTTTATATTTNLLDLNAFNNNNNNDENNDNDDYEILTQQTISAEKSSAGAVVNVGIESANSGGSILPSNSITTYYGGGLGLFHQQNLRANAVGGSFLSSHGNSGNGGGSGSSYPNTINGNVNLLLGGAMLSLVTTIFCVVCYCCHRNIKKRTEAAYRQQRQWLESDPNMEIYSVEQCYETSGLFLGDSTDGLSSIPALHHEPPPSYDAVVAMQEQLLQQQQQHQHSRTSPPPGYRSSLDVHMMGQTTFAVAGCGVRNPAAPAAQYSSRGTLVDDMSSTNDSNGNLSTGTTAATVHHHHNNAYQQQQQQQQQKPPTAQQLMGLNPLLNMKKVLQAQSCCSLQRAEVENMWNAAAAAVAARNGATTATANAQNSRAMMQQQQPQHSSSTPSTSATPTPAMLMMARKSLPTYAFGRHYRHQKSYYRRGCPLCGKFRYDTEDALSHCSNESVVDDISLAGNVCYPKVDEGEEENPLMAIKQNGHGNSENNNNTIVGNDDNADDIDEDVDESDECLCAGQTPNRSQQSLATTSFVTAKQQLQENDYKNGNELASALSSSSSSASLSFMAQQFVVVDANEPTTNMNMDDNANMTTAALDNEQPESSNQATSNVADTTNTNTNTNTIDLNSINENGIVRLDMSKIIDKTGLPTYEAALKLDSSGYV